MAKFTQYTLIIALLVACTSPKKPDLVMDYVKNPILFEIKKGTSTHYLLGTIHYSVDKKNIYQTVLNKLSASTAFVSEVGFDTDEIPLNRYSDDSYYYYLDGGRTLDADLSKVAFDELVTKMSSIFSISKIKTWKPHWAWSSLESQKHVPKEPMVQSNPGNRNIEVSPIFDNILRREAKVLGLQLGYLEDMTSETIEECENLDGISKIENWALRFHPEDLALKTIAERSNEKANECVTVGRNKAWLPKLLRYLEANETVFVAVGAAHVVLNRPNLVELLTRVGYKVNRIAVNQPREIKFADRQRRY